MIPENDFLRRGLGACVLLCRTAGREFRSLVPEGDDEDVQNFFQKQADVASDEAEYFLNYSAGEVDGTNDLSEFVTQIPLALASARIGEERILQGIIAVFTALNAKRAAFAGLRQLALENGVSDLAEAAAKVEAQAEEAAGCAWHFLPSRSKIAFNMLTLDEVDPAVDTKMAGDRIG